MNKKAVITTDSTVDISPELLERFGIGVIPLMVTLGEESFPDSPEFTYEKIYQRYREDGSLPKTSAPSLSAYLEFFGSYTSQGFEVVHLSLSSGLSSSCSTACIAASELGGVYVVDTKMLSSAIGLLAMEASELSSEGMSAAEIAAELEVLREKTNCSFVLDTLEYLWKGGRCSGIAALGANLLKLRPALEMKNGKLEIYKKYRGTMPSVYRSYIRERLSGKKIRKGRLIFTNSGAIDGALLEGLKEFILAETGAKELYTEASGCTISSHCGPGCLGVLFIEE